MTSYRLTVGAVLVAAVGFIGFTQLASAEDAAAPAAHEQKGKKGDRKGGGPLKGGGPFKAVHELSGLTEEQKDKIKSIATAHADKAKAIRDEAGGGRPDKARMQEVMKDARTQIDAVLTDAQKSELTEKLKAAGGDHKGGKGDRKPGKADSTTSEPHN